MLRNIALFLSLLSSASLIQAQAPAAANLQPQYRDQYVGVVSGKMVLLERVRKTLSTEHRRLFVITPTDRIFDSIPNASSPVRLPADTHFLVRMETGGRDPLTLIHLQPLKSTRKDREITKITVKASLIPFGGVHQNNAADTTLALNVKDLGNGTLEITPTKPLPPGEYAFISGFEAQCFGVDAGDDSAGATLMSAATAPATPPPPKPATWKIEDVPEISTAGQDVTQSTAGLMGHDVIGGRQTEAYLSMHCGFPATEYPDMLPLEVILGGTDEMFNSPALPGAWVDISSFAYSSLGAGHPLHVSAVAQNRSTGARVRFFYEAPDMQAIVDAPGQVLTLSLGDGGSGGNNAVSAQFRLPSDNAPLKRMMNECLQTKAVEEAAIQASVVARCPAAPVGSVLDAVQLTYAGTGREVKGNFSEEDASASWKLPVPVKGQTRRPITMSCAYRTQTDPQGATATAKVSVPVPTNARACAFRVHQNELRSAAVCTSTLLRTADRPRVVTPVPPL